MHPFWVAEPRYDGSVTIDERVVETCGKMEVLDAMLVHLRACGHKVLIFSQFKTVRQSGWNPFEGLMGHYLFSCSSVRYYLPKQFVVARLVSLPLPHFPLLFSLLLLVYSAAMRRFLTSSKTSSRGGAVMQGKRGP